MRKIKHHKICQLVTTLSLLLPTQDAAIGCSSQEWNYPTLQILAHVGNGISLLNIPNLLKHLMRKTRYKKGQNFADYY